MSSKIFKSFLQLVIVGLFTIQDDVVSGLSIMNVPKTSKSTSPESVSSSRRRDVLKSSIGGFLGTLVTSTNILPLIAVADLSLLSSSSSPANAFDNAIPDYAKYTEKTKRRGTPPKDLGLRLRTTEGENDEITELGLRSCDGNPNCFSTTGDFRLEDRQQYGVDFLISPWIPPVDDPNPFQTLKDVVTKTYEPGQGGIDGGGFAVIESTDSYLYCQFESLKKGFIDDVEFAVTPKSKGVLVRSASRLGFTDFGVNAIRLNYIASKLRAKGWTISDITSETHRDYWNAAEEAREATFDPDRRRMVGA